MRMNIAGFRLLCSTSQNNRNESRRESLLPDLAYRVQASVQYPREVHQPKDVDVVEAVIVTQNEKVRHLLRHRDTAKLAVFAIRDAFMPYLQAFIFVGPSDLHGVAVNGSIIFERVPQVLELALVNFHFVEGIPAVKLAGHTRTKSNASDLAPKFYPVLSSLQRFFEVLPDFGPAGAGISGVMAQLGGGADEPFISEIGTLLPIALCGRNSL